MNSLCISHWQSTKTAAVVIDGMESFSHYFCLAKQKMTPLALHASPPEEEEVDEEEKAFFEDGAVEIADEDDDLCQFILQPKT